MNIKKGYIIPVILVLLLLISAGFVLFTKKVSKTPIVEPLVPEISTSTDTVDFVEDTDNKDNSATTSDDTQATTSTTTDFEE